MVSWINVYALNEFEKSLECEIQQFFNPIANILPTNEESNRNNISTPFSKNNDLTDSNELQNSKSNYWYYLKGHKLPSCQKFISLILNNKKYFVKRSSRLK